MNYLTEIKPLEDAGLTDTQIATILEARTITDIPSERVRLYFSKEDLWLTDPATGLRLAGAIGQAYSGLTAPQQELVRKLHAWVFGQDSIESENDDDVATLLKQILSGMVTLTILTGAQALKVYSFGGGLRYPSGVTAQDVSDERDAYDADVVEQARIDAINALRAEIENTWINPAEADGVTTAVDLRATIKAEL